MYVSGQPYLESNIICLMLVRIKYVFGISSLEKINDLEKFRKRMSCESYCLNLFYVEIYIADDITSLCR